MTSPEISVVIPTHNRRDLLANLLVGLAVQTYPAERWELIVVNDNSTDGTHGLLEEFATDWPNAFTRTRGKYANPSAVRNAGAEYASGRVLIFLDDDMTVSPDFVEGHANAHAQSGIAAIGRIVAPSTRRDPWTAWDDAHLARLADALVNGRRAPGPRDYYSGNCSVDADLFRAVGGYATNIGRAEDIDLGYRLEAAGARFAYCAEAVSVHHGTHRFENWVRNAAAFGKTEVTLAREFGHSADFAGWYRDRHVLNQTLVRACCTYPALQEPVIAAMNLVGRGSYAIGVRDLANAAYSAIYNLAYWQGLISEFGSDRFWREADRRPADTTLPSVP